MLKAQRFHTFPINTGSMVAVTGQSQQSLLVETDYNFFWFKSAAYVFDAAGAGIDPRIWPDLTVVLQDGASQQNLSTGEVSLSNMFGVGQLPYVVPVPHIIEGGSTFSVTVYNRHTTTAYSARLALSGMLVAKGMQPTFMRVRGR